MKNRVVLFVSLFMCTISIGCVLMHDSMTFSELESLDNDEIQTLLTENSTSSAFLYMKGFRAYAMNPVETVYYFHKAVRYAPTSTLYREQLAQIESEFGLEQQVEIPWFLSSDIAYLGMLCCWVILCLLLVLFVFGKKRSQTKIGLFVCGGLFVCFAIYFFLARSIERVDFDVVYRLDASIARIPSKDSQNRIAIKPGTVLYTHEKFEDYIRVTNGSELSGWIHQSALLFQEHEEFE